MKRYVVEGYQSTYCRCEVYADSPEEALEKGWSGDAIEGTQDTDPGKNIWKKKWSAEEGEVLSNYT